MRNVIVFIVVVGVGIYQWDNSTYSKKKAYVHAIEYCDGEYKDLSLVIEKLNEYEEMNQELQNSIKEDQSRIDGISEEKKDTEEFRSFVELIDKINERSSKFESKKKKYKKKYADFLVKCEGRIEKYNTTKGPLIFYRKLIPEKLERNYKIPGET